MQPTYPRRDGWTTGECALCAGVVNAHIMIPANALPAHQQRSVLAPARQCPFCRQKEYGIDDAGTRATELQPLSDLFSKRPLASVPVSLIPVLCCYSACSTALLMLPALSMKQASADLCGVCLSDCCLTGCVCHSADRGRLLPFGKD